MTNNEQETFQLRFEDGALVEDPTANETTSADHTADPIEPGARTGYTVEAKAGALEVNAQLRAVTESHGGILAFGSRHHAEAYAGQLSASDGSLRIQAVPENEPKDIDAYLLADHNPSIKEPADVDGDTWTFDVGANLYGALGEAILLESPKPHALVYFVRQDLDIDEDNLEWGLNVDVNRGRLLSVDCSDGKERWTPDCVVEAKDGWDGALLERYYCEIKTGGASFERSQVESMEALARNERILKIRVSIEELPDQYSLRIREVAPSQ
ncbi:hypothetical protein EGH21_21875 [Halomicroarcula sp. F13]|uniref:Protein NO VEIN C-terminal domain-containing protein n=1 Tax=Haloarcula rubra TaxID=2487747 RepID=A0AAW4PWW6_9EURY|nr:hypothetical protein [Halomicroarcula rubra]MBX0325669.1 hypothetical protein [Halomicroarcula rubra]